MLAILAKHPDGIQSIRRILKKLATLKGSSRKAAFQELFILAGLRRLGNVVREEVKRMPILEDIMKHDVLGPTFRQGRKEGLERGLEKGRQEGELNLLRGLIKKRFGALPARAEKRLTKLSAAELEQVSLRLFDAKSVEELFGR